MNGFISSLSDQRYDGAFLGRGTIRKEQNDPSRKTSSRYDVAVEINTYEQLRELDSNSNQLKSDAIETAAKALNTPPEAITRITVLKKGDDQPFFPF